MSAPPNPTITTTKTTTTTTSETKITNAESTVVSGSDETLSTSMAQQIFRAPDASDSEDEENGTTGDAPPGLQFPPVTEEQILNCTYPSWYTIFGPRHAIRTLILPMPPAFLQYLNADGILLPPSENFGMANAAAEDIDSDYYSGVSETESDASDDTVQMDPTTHFPNFHQQVVSAIQQLGGKVSVKLDWSAPRDASWILPGNSGECRTAGEVYLLLKTSGLVSFDLGDPYEKCTKERGTIGEEAKRQRHLVLREWKEVQPSMEFRVWVKGKKVVGICQRDDNYYDFLEKMHDEIKDRILDFFEDYIEKKYPDSEYTFDVYLDYPSTKIYIIDFNPFAAHTDPLLFSWTELLDMDPDMIQDPQLRLVRKGDPEAWSHSGARYSAYKMPLEVVDAGSGGLHSIQEFAEKWKEIVEGVKDMEAR